MLIDARQLDRDLETDVCIIGAGPAGIAVALQLSRAGISTVVLAGGGEEPDSAHQQLSRVQQVGAATDDTTKGNIRAFGGTAHVWSGWCLKLDPIDFEARPWIPNSGWPITRADLEPYYVQAHELCQIASPDYDPAAHLSAPHQKPDLILRTPILKNAVILVNATRFGAHYRKELLASQSVQVCLYGVAVELESDINAKHITAVRCKTLSGRPFRVRSRRVVVAAGAIESARLLLCSRSANPAGLGNERGLVGRYFMQHPVFRHASLLTVDADGWLRVGRGDKARGVGIATALTEQIQRSQQLPNCHFLLTGFDNGLHESVNFRSRLQLTWQRFRRVYWGPQAHSDVPRLAALLERGERSAFATSLGSILLRPEQVPSPESRILLSEEPDRLGMPGAVMDWRLTELDWEFVNRCLSWIGCGVGAEGIGRIRMRSAAARSTAAELLHGGYHYFGTTRMSEGPATGVVDRNCKVHGIDNLYVASSSVFPTCGYANPTLTIVALAVRLASRLESE